MAAGFGAFGGLGGLGAPMRNATPNSNTVASPFADWGGSPDAWQADWQRRYDEEAAKARPQTGWRVEHMYGAPDYDPVAAKPFQDQTRNFRLQQLFGDQWQEMGEAIAARPEIANSLQWFSPESFDFGSQGASAVSQSYDYDPGFNPDFSALNDEKARLNPFVENTLRQQQAYDWMQGGQQENALMSPDYANAGFNSITGMSNPNAGPGQIDGVGMDWAHGVYDPTTQQGTGTYQPAWQRNTNFGW